MTQRSKCETKLGSNGANINAAAGCAEVRSVALHQEILAPKEMFGTARMAVLTAATCDTAQLCPLHRGAQRNRHVIHCWEATSSGNSVLRRGRATLVMAVVWCKQYFALACMDCVCWGKQLRFQQERWFSRCRLSRGCASDSVTPKRGTVARIFLHCFGFQFVCEMYNIKIDCARGQGHPAQRYVYTCMIASDARCY
jgi:hypothetical protein